MHALAAAATLLLCILAAFAGLAPLPGTQFAGLGFNAVTQELTNLPIIELYPVAAEASPKCLGPNCGVNRQCMYNRYQGKDVALPENICVSYLNSTQAMLITQVMQNISTFDSYYSHTTSSKKHRKTTTRTEEYYVHDYYEADRSLAFTENSTFLYELSFFVLMRTPHPRTQKVLQGLPRDYSTEAARREYREVVETLGTDYVASVVIGGQRKMESRFYRCYLSEYSAEWVSEETTKNYAIVSKSDESSWGWETIDKEFLETTNVRYEYAGGIPCGFNPGEDAGWLDSMYDIPVPVMFTIAPIADLIGDNDIRENYATAVTEYESEMRDTLDDQIKMLEPLDPDLNLCD